MLVSDLVNIKVVVWDENNIILLFLCSFWENM